MEIIEPTGEISNKMSFATRVGSASKETPSERIVQHAGKLTEEYFMENDRLLRELTDQKFAIDQAAIVALTDAQGVIRYVNTKFCEISGYTPPEILGNTHRVINSGYHSNEFFAGMWKTIQSGQVWRGEICNRAKDGHTYWVGTTIVPFVDEDGLPYQYLAIRQDITALKLAQAQITEQQEQIVQASRLSAIGEMAAAITHEINNPLAVILGRAEMLRFSLEEGVVDTNTLIRTVETIESTAKRIERIVRSMRQLSRQNREEEPLVSTRLSEVLTDSLELCSQRLRNHGILLHADFPKGEIFFQTRAHELVQVLVNLLNNAHDAVLKLQDRWVRLQVADRGGTIEFAVADSGRGIPNEVQKKMFDPFYSTKDAQIGTGLGLSISQSLVSGLGGQLCYDADSPFTRFYFILPKK